MRVGRGRAVAGGCDADGSRRPRSDWRGAGGADDPACPMCGSAKVKTGTKHVTQPYLCRERGWCQQFSQRKGTVMAGKKLSCQTWATATYLLTTGIKGVSLMKLHRDRGGVAKLAWFPADPIPGGWGTNGRKFQGPVEVDEGYMGGMERNLYKSKSRKGVMEWTPLLGTRGRVPAKVIPDGADGIELPSPDDRERGQALRQRPEPGERQPLGRRVRPRHGAHQRSGVVLGFDEARLARHPPQRERQASAEIRRRVRGPPQRRSPGHARPDGRARPRAGEQATEVLRAHGLNRLSADLLPFMTRRHGDPS